MSKNIRKWETSNTNTESGEQPPPRSHCKVNYRELTVLVPVTDLFEAMELVVETGRTDRVAMMASVAQALAESYPQVIAQTASLELAMSLGQDVAIWFANEVLEGRAALPHEWVAPPAEQPQQRSENRS
jgi:hypothetical protein